MGTVDKKALSERDICTKYITPAIRNGGWDLITQVREEVNITKGQVLDIKNPNVPEEQNDDPEELLAQYHAVSAILEETRESLKQELARSLMRTG
ncbi:MAG: hypothetical protein M0P69_09050 [Bacteroidales bacterium]|nr:hypothetical protein [Bacteroidales bacterium]